MFLIGEFSKVARVSKRSLHHYDEIGLLKPAYIDHTTGYRYYSASQLTQLNRILALKDLGIPLYQVAKMLHTDISDEEITGMLILKKAEIEETLLEDIQRLRGIEARLQQNQASQNIPDVVIKSIPTQLFYSVRTTFSTEDEIFPFIDQILYKLPANVNSSALGSLVGIFYDHDFKSSGNDVEIGYFVKKPVEPLALTKKHILQMRELPAVEMMASSIQDGGIDPVLLGFGKIARWIEEHGYKMTTPYREIMFDVTNIRDLQNTVIEIQIPVEKLPPSTISLNFAN